MCYYCFLYCTHASIHKIPLDTTWTTSKWQTSLKKRAECAEPKVLWNVLHCKFCVICGYYYYNKAKYWNQQNPKRPIDNYDFSHKWGHQCPSEIDSAAGESDTECPIIFTGCGAAGRSLSLCNSHPSHIWSPESISQACVIAKIKFIAYNVFKHQGWRTLETMLNL